MRPMDFFFEPKSIAVIGASTKRGKVGYEIVKSLLESGFEGDVYPVHKRGEEIAGEDSFRSIQDVPADFELAIVAIPAKSVPETLEECAKKGAKGVVIISGGFKELNDEGAVYQKEAVKSAMRKQLEN